MKTLRIFLMMALVFVFITITIEAQTVTSSQVFDEGNYESSAIADNGTYGTIVVEMQNADNGFSKLIEKQSNGSYSILQTYELTEGSGSSASVQGCITTISNNGVSYVDYMYDWSGDDMLARLQKNLLNGSSITVLEYVNDGIASMKSVGGDLYLVFGAGADFDPGTLGGLPNLTGGYFVMKIDGTTDQYVWSTFLGNDFVWNSDVEFIVKSGDSDNIYLNKSDGDLIKFSRSTGANLETVKEGSEGDKYKFDEDGNLHRQICCEHSLLIYDESDNYNTVLFQTDWSQANLWNSGMKNWRLIDDLLYGVNMTKTLHLNEELIHGYIAHTNSEINPSTVKDEWVNENGTFGYLTETGGIISMITVDEGNENENLIPTLNDSDTDIVTVLDGYTYNGESWDEAYHQSTIVFEDGTLPSVGSTPSTTWIDAASGTSLIVLFPIETDSRSGELIFRGVYRKDGTASHDINIKVILVEESDVTLDNYVVSITKLSDGEEPGTDTQFEVSVSPVNNSGSAITGNISYTGTATEWDDYDGVSNFSISNGSSSTMITLITNDDAIYEGTETIVATISGLSNGSLGTDNSTANLEDNETSGVDKIKEMSISIYPNPAIDYINLTSDLKIEEVQIYDLTAKLCFQMNLDSDQIDISGLKSGMYFMKILVDGSFITKKFIKK